MKQAVKYRYRTILFIVLSLTSLQIIVNAIFANAQVYTPSFVRKWGSSGSGDGQFGWPLGIAVDSLGNVYVLDEAYNRVEKFDSNGNFIRTWGGLTYPYNPSENWQLFNPVAIAVSRSGDVYVSDYNDADHIHKFDSNGNFIAKWGPFGGLCTTDFLRAPTIAVSRFGDIFTASIPVDGEKSQCVQEFTSGGNFVTRLSTNLTSAMSIATDSKNNVYVVVFDNVATTTTRCNVVKLDSNGKFITKWGSCGQADGQFGAPAGIAVDSYDNVYVADIALDRIQKFDSNGNFITKWGSHGTGDGQFNEPLYIAIDPSDYIYVTDGFNHRVQVFR